MRQTPSDQSHHLHLHIGFANVNGKGIAEATWNFGGRSQGRWNKGLSYIIYQRAQIFGEDPSPIPRTSPYFRACVEVWDGIRMGSARLQVGTGDTWNHLKSLEIHLNHFRSHEALEAFTEKLHRQLAEASVGVAPRNSPSPFPDGLYYWSLASLPLLWAFCHQLQCISSVGCWWNELFVCLPGPKHIKGFGGTTCWYCTQPSDAQCRLPCLDLTKEAILFESFEPCFSMLSRQSTRCLDQWLKHHWCQRLVTLHSNDDSYG